MYSHEDENTLIDYIVGALGDDEASVIKQRLLNDAEFSRKYARLLQIFRPALQERDRESLQLEPPLHLAERTMAFITKHAPAMSAAVVRESVHAREPVHAMSSSDSGTQLHLVLPPEMRPNTTVDESMKNTISQRVQETQVHGPRPVGVKLTEKQATPVRTSRFSVLDVTVALGLLLCIGCFMIQAIAFSQQSARVTLCQNNLMQLGKALNVYALAHHGEYPSVKHIDNQHLQVAGIYGPILVDMDAQLAKNLFCPDVTKMRKNFSTPKVPSFSELTQMDPEEVKKQEHILGGDYAYNIGYIQDGQYIAPRCDTRTDLPLLADRQSVDYANRSVKVLAHGKDGYNALYKDGSVRFRANKSHERDHYFVNDAFQVALGDNLDDTILGYSEVRVKP